jgi:hypothetical protein
LATALITQTINTLDINQISSNLYNITAESTLRIYGSQIPPLAGDFNINGSVDAADYVVWRKRSPNYDPMPNGSGQGIFAGIAVPEDYGYWRANFGRTVSGGMSVSTIPEPASFVLAICAYCLLRWIRLPRV